MREEWQAFREDHAGERFRNHYRRLRDRGSMKLRAIGIALGVLLLAAGAILLFVPGPGLLVIAFGLALFAGESKTLARWLDRAEPALRRRLARIKARFRRRDR